MFKCNICGKEFGNALQLGGHKSSHARFGKMKAGTYYKFNCKNCDKEVEKYIKPSYSERPKPTYCTIACKSEWYAKNVYGSHATSFVKIDNDILDITNEELKSYRKEHTVCEICGKEEKVSTRKDGVPNNLAVDHNHTTKRFRGLLCYSCNIKVGWIESNWDRAKEYLEKDGFIF